MQLSCNLRFDCTRSTKKALWIEWITCFSSTVVVSRIDGLGSYCPPTILILCLSTNEAKEPEIKRRTLCNWNYMDMMTNPEEYNIVRLSKMVKGLFFCPTHCEGVAIGWSIVRKNQLKESATADAAFLLCAASRSILCSWYAFQTSEDTTSLQMELAIRRLHTRIMNK